MLRYKPQDRNSVAFAQNHLVEHEPDLRSLDGRFKFVLLAYAASLRPNRHTALACNLHTQRL